MKASPCLYLLTCLAMAFLECAFHRAYAEERPVKYIFELSDEPVKVRPGKIDTKSVFFPKYARGTSPEALKRQAAIFQTPEEQEAPENKVGKRQLGEETRPQKPERNGAGRPQKNDND